MNNKTFIFNKTNTLRQQGKSVLDMFFLKIDIWFVET